MENLKKNYCNNRLSEIFPNVLEFWLSPKGGKYPHILKKTPNRPPGFYKCLLQLNTT